MTETMTQQELILELVLKKRDGWSNRKLAKAFHISRNTVRSLLEKANREREEGHDALPAPKTIVRPSLVDPYIEQIQSLLDQYPDATGVRLFEEIQAKGYKGQISILRDKLRELRKSVTRTPVIRFETDPGVQGQMDWSPFTLKLKDGSRLEVICFSYILGFSRRHYIDFTLRRDFYTLIRRHQDTFRYYGGVPKQCLYDNEKTVVLRWEAGKPLYNPSFLQFITHYLCRPIACRPRTPQTKGKIEEPFRPIKSNLLNCRTFTDLEHLRSTARWWMANKSDLHPHDTTRRQPLELFLEQEQSALAALPGHDYDSSQIAFVLGREEGIVEWKTNRYSIPYQFVGDILTLRATESEVTLYDPELKPLGTHPRLPDSAHQKHDLTEHRVSIEKQRYGLESVRENFLALGEAAYEFLDGVVRKFPRNPGFHARRILMLKERYHSDDIDKAIAHALRYHAFEAAAIERILNAKFTPRTLEQLVIDKKSAELRQVLPHVSQRSLAEYNQAFGQKDTSNTEEEPNDDTESNDDETP